MKITEEFNIDIQGEKLLYENKEEYTKEESELIVKTVAKRMSKNYYYASLIKNYMPTLLDKVLPNIEESELTEEKAIIANDYDRFKKLPLTYGEEEHDFAHYSLKIELGIPNNDDYFDTIKKSRLDARYFESILEDENVLFLYEPDTNFFITANILFARYPEFYNSDYVLNIVNVAHDYKRKDGLNKQELNEYKTARKATLNNVKKYVNKTKKEAKIMHKALKGQY